MSTELLLEIGTEEIPAHFMPGILSQLADVASVKLTEARLDFKSVHTLGTPRRLALIVKGLATCQREDVTEYKGPSAKIAYDGEGNFSKAALGFARSKGVAQEDLIIKDDYIYAIVKSTGVTAAEILPTLLVEIINSLTFPKNMRWGNLDYRFVRPIRWIVALLDDQVIDFELANVHSGRVSRGHRFLSTGDFTIEHARDYEKACGNNFVIVDQEKRKALIVAEIERISRENNAHTIIDPDLLEEVLYLVEYPTGLCGNFEDKYIKLPEAVVITPMRDHQRYFPMYDEHNKLLPKFITIRNGNSHSLEIVQHGNERVLRARLADAEFFFNEDRKQSLEAYLPQLSTVVFQEGLGTMLDKSERLVKLTEFIGHQLNIDETTIKQACRAAYLAKADLVTSMVGEFSELQGVMGKEYALLDGEDPAVAIAIDEHYQPRHADDAQPQSTAGKLVSIADKIDNIVATFSRGLVPTGSQDPFALRRQALGIVNTLKENNYKLSIAIVAAYAMDLLGIDDTTTRSKIHEELTNFFMLRLKNILSDNKVRYDIANAVINLDDLISNIYNKAIMLQVVATVPEFVDFVQAFVRVSNLASKTTTANFSDELFIEEAEKELAHELTDIQEKFTNALTAEKYALAIKLLSALIDPINKFFEQVMVMAEDEKIRQNRLGLLKSIDNLAKQIGDFTQIVLS